MLYQRNFFVSPKEPLCFTKGTSLFHQRNLFVFPKEHLCLTKGTSLFYQREHLCFTKGNTVALPEETSLFYQRKFSVQQKEPLYFTKGNIFVLPKERKTSPRLGAHRNRLQPRGNGERCRCWRRFISTGTVAMINCDDERDDDHHHHHDRIVCNTDCTIVIADQT